MSRTVLFVDAKAFPCISAAIQEELIRLDAIVLPPITDFTDFVKETLTLLSKHCCVIPSSDFNDVFEEFPDIDVFNGTFQDYFCQFSGNVSFNVVIAGSICLPYELDDETLKKCDFFITGGFSLTSGEDAVHVPTHELGENPFCSNMFLSRVNAAERTVTLFSGDRDSIRKTVEDYINDVSTTALECIFFSVYFGDTRLFYEKEIELALHSNGPQCTEPITVSFSGHKVTMLSCADVDSVCDNINDL